MSYKRRVEQRGYLYQSIPHKLSYLTRDKKIVFNGKNIKTDYLINIIHEFITKFYTHKDDIIEKELKFNMWSLLLKKKYGHIYNYYINYLIDIGFIRMTSDYYAQKKARTYTINTEFLVDIERVKVFDKILLKKHTRDYLLKTFLNYNNSPIALDIREKLSEDLFDIDVDVPSAMKYLRTLIKEDGIETAKYTKNVMSLDNIEHNHIYFKFDEYGRMHTNFTTLKRHIRKNFLKMEGQDIMEVDLSNSQPLFLAVLMKKEMSARQIIHPGITRYIQLVKNGLIYEEIMDKCGISEREDAKTMMYKVLFGVNGDFADYNKLFNRVFPEVFNFIIGYKQKKKSHKTLSHALQNAESEFIFGSVVRHLMKSNPEIKMFTVHDSICFPVKYQEIVTNVFNYYKRQLL